MNPCRRPGKGSRSSWTRPTRPPLISCTSPTSSAETRQALLILENARQQATARLQLGAALRAKMHAEFALVEYENERSKQLEELGNLAKQAAGGGRTRRLRQLPRAHGRRETAHTCCGRPCRSPTACCGRPSSARSPPSIRSRCRRCSPMPRPPTACERLAEIPLHLEFTGSATSAEKLLQCLPLRADEIRAAGLPEAPADKPAAFH